MLTRVRAALRKRNLELGELTVFVAAFFTAAATDMVVINEEKWGTATATLTLTPYVR